MNQTNEVQPSWLSEPTWLEFLLKLHPSGHWDSTPEQLSYFDAILGIPAREAITRLEKAGLIVKPTLQQRLITLTINDLKPLLKENGLKVSGRKAELIERIIENVPPDRVPLVEADLFVLSDTAKELALGWREAKKARKAEAIHSVVAHLENDDVEAAVDAVFLYEREQVFKRGIGCDWESESFKNTLTNRCKLAMTCRPAALAHLSNEQLKKVCTVAATRDLFGQGYADWAEDYLKESPDLADDKILSAPTNFAHYRYRAVSAKEVGWKLRIDTSVCEERGCTFCPRLDGQIYEPDEAPELPFPECPMEGPCMAIYTYDHQFAGTPCQAEHTQDERPGLPVRNGAETQRKIEPNWPGYVGLALAAIAILLALVFGQRI